MDSIENLENIENMELYNLIANSANLLKQNNNEVGEDYLSIAFAEGIIPKTRVPIKEFVLKSYNDLSKKNNHVRRLNNPFYRLLYSNLDYDLAGPLLEYFEDERKCLDTLKNFLNSKLSIPVSSFSGVFTSTLIHIHNINIDKINNIIDLTQNLKNSPFSITLPNDCTVPYKHEFVNEIESTISKILIKK